MDKGILVGLSGEQVAETAHALAVRLIEHHREVKVVETAGMDTPKALEAICHFVHNGFVVLMQGVALPADWRETIPILEIEIAPYDTPDFAAEKILDELAEVGALTLQDAVYSPEDEERIRKRLADLGYIE